MKNNHLNLLLCLGELESHCAHIICATIDHEINSFFGRNIGWNVQGKRWEIGKNQSKCTAYKVINHLCLLSELFNALFVVSVICCNVSMLLSQSWFWKMMYVNSFFRLKYTFDFQNKGNYVVNIFNKKKTLGSDICHRPPKTIIHD